MTSSVPIPETIDKLASAVYPSFAMLAGMQLDLFTPLKDGPLSAEQLAAALEVRADKLQPLLYALVVAGLLTVDGERFANTPEADYFLVRSRPTYRDGAHVNLQRRWDAILKTADTIRAGSPQAKLDFSTLTPERMEPLARNREGETTAAAQELMARFDLSPYRRLLDVGGGAGYLSITVARANPQLEATVMDLPSVTWITQRVLEEVGATDRVRVVTADVLNRNPPGTFDVAVMRHFVQVLSPEQVRSALRNISQAVEPGGVVYIMGEVIDNSRTSPAGTVAYNLMFLNTYDEGQAYTEQEHRDWLAEAGFTEAFERVTLPNGTSIIRASKRA